MPDQRLTQERLSRSSVSKDRDELNMQRWGGKHTLSEGNSMSKGPEVRPGTFMGRNEGFIVLGA